MNLTEKTCVELLAGSPALTPAQIATLLPQVPGWELVADKKELSRAFKFENYLAGADFVLLVAGLAQAQDHHPDIELGYKKATVRYSTHSVNGLSENDFICAAKINALQD